MFFFSAASRRVVIRCGVAHCEAYGTKQIKFLVFGAAALYLEQNHFPHYLWPCAPLPPVLSVKLGKKSRARKYPPRGGQIFWEPFGVIYRPLGYTVFIVKFYPGVEVVASA